MVAEVSVERAGRCERQVRPCTHKAMATSFTHLLTYLVTRLIRMIRIYTSTIGTELPFLLLLAAQEARMTAILEDSSGRRSSTPERSEAKPGPGEEENR